MATRIGIFAKHWTPGQTKTRLASAVGPDVAAACSKEFLKTTLLRLSLITSSRQIAFTPTTEKIAFEELLDSLSITWQLIPQPAGDLGEKMSWFFEQALESGHKTALLLGSDSPDFPIKAVEKGLEWLNDNAHSHSKGKLLLGPATDGGYWCVGAQGVVPPIFEQMPWSEPNLMECTLKKLDQLGWQMGTDYLLLDEWYDVDREADLMDLQTRIKMKNLTDENDPLVKLSEWISRSIYPESL